MLNGWLTHFAWKIISHPQVTFKLLNKGTAGCWNSIQLLKLVPVAPLFIPCRKGIHERSRSLGFEEESGLMEPFPGSTLAPESDLSHFFQVPEWSKTLCYITIPCFREKISPTPGKGRPRRCQIGSTTCSRSGWRMTTSARDPHSQRC